MCGEVLTPMIADQDARREGTPPQASHVLGEPLMQFFANAHLPPPLRAVSQPFLVLAEHLVVHLPRNPERTVALRKLLEAKDCAVRAALWREPAPPTVAA